MAVDLLFYFGFALLITHELDAIHRHEWRIFPFICKLKDDVGYYVFVILHIPLLTLLLCLLCYPSENVQYWFKLSMDIFFIMHLGLHLLLKTHIRYEFNNVFSRSIILLNALVGFIHLIFVVG